MGQENSGFWGNETSFTLVTEYGSPLYVYNENILRERCRELTKLVSYQHFVVDYSMKANSNPALLQILREEGVEVDVVSEGELYIAEMAGYQSNEIFFVSNNISEDEMQRAIRKGIRISVDSLSQLEQFGRLSPHSKVAIRVNPGVGAGHHAKVVTAGKHTKFGISMDQLADIKTICAKYNLTVAGINQHVGSLFLEDTKFLASTQNLLAFSKNFDELDFIDFGGGYGVPYHHEEGRLDLAKLGTALNQCIREFVTEYGREIQFRIEPGRYLVAESGILLGTVYAIKENASTKYIGTDLGFNNLIRPVLYDSFHEAQVYRKGKKLTSDSTETVTIVGNVCESGDILAKDRKLPTIQIGDIICIENTGAYGHAMSSNYNSRLRPAEVLIQADGSARLIRRRDSYADLVRNYIL